VVTGLVVIVLLLTLFSCESRSRGALQGPGSAQVAGVEFAIRGDTAERMTPGQMVSIDVEITNPYDVGMVVTELDVSLRDVTAPRATEAHPCSLADFVVKPPARVPKQPTGEIYRGHCLAPDHHNGHGHRGHGAPSARRHS
jgi:hypothetical protein